MKRTVTIISAEDSALTFSERWYLREVHTALKRFGKLTSGYTESGKRINRLKIFNFGWGSGNNDGTHVVYSDTIGQFHASPENGHPFPLDGRPNGRHSGKVKVNLFLLLALNNNTQF